MKLVDNGLKEFKLLAARVDRIISLFKSKIQGGINHGKKQNK